MRDILAHELRTRLDTARRTADPVRRYRLMLEVAGQSLADMPAPTGSEAARRLRAIGFRPSEVRDFVDDAIGLALGAREEAVRAAAVDLPRTALEIIASAVHGARTLPPRPLAATIGEAAETIAGAVFTFAALPAFLIFIVQPLMG